MAWVHLIWWVVSPFTELAFQHSFRNFRLHIDIHNVWMVLGVWAYLVTGLIGNGGMMHSDNWQQNFAVEDTVWKHLMVEMDHYCNLLSWYYFPVSSRFLLGTWMYDFLTLGLHQDMKPHYNPSSWYYFPVLSDRGWKMQMYMLSLSNLWTFRQIASRQPSVAITTNSYY